MLNNKNVINNFNEKNKGKKLNSLKTRSKDEKAHILTYKSNTTENNEKNKKKEDLNDLPYSKAIKMDKRNIFHTFFSFAIEKFDIINIFLVDSRIKIILFEEFIISLVINFFFNALLYTLLYTDDVVSNKYHNNGELDLIVTLSLSIVSNIVTSIFCYYTKYSRGIDERMNLIVDIRYDVQYFKNLTKFLLFLKIKFICFFIGQLLSFATCIYYLVIFCILYKRSQESLIINYGYSLIESIIISFGIALIIVITRKIGLSCLNKNLCNISGYNTNESSIQNNQQEDSEIKKNFKISKKSRFSFVNNYTENIEQKNIFNVPDFVEEILNKKIFLLSFTHLIKGQAQHSLEKYYSEEVLLADEIKIIKNWALEK